MRKLASIRQVNTGPNGIQVNEVRGNLTIVQAERACWKTQSCWQRCNFGVDEKLGSSADATYLPVAR